METPLQITFKHMEPSAAVEARIRKSAQRLNRFFDRITGCHVLIEAPAAHRHHGAPYTVRIDLIVPGREIHVDSARAPHSAHTDLYVALRDAFDSAKRLLQDYARERRQDVKHHEPPLLGTVAEISADGSFGRIAGDDGRLLYFHRHSVHGADFDKLAVGMVVEFEAEQGDQGLQAAAVRLWRSRAQHAPVPQ